ncbi:MAG: hypothetical protein RIM23_23915 [Coleofasciculus sp. G3-WIS-01]
MARLGAGGAGYVSTSSETSLLPIRSCRLFPFQSTLGRLFDLHPT